MSISKKIKVAYICHVSNSIIRSNIELSKFRFSNIIRGFLRVPKKTYKDYGVWNTLSFQYYEKCKDIELHVITPHPGTVNGLEEFNYNNIFYHIFNQQLSIFDHTYKQNRKYIKKILKSINPDIIMIIGIESPFYALSILDIETNDKPIVAALQTFLSDPDFLENYPINREVYNWRSNIERNVLHKIQYIASDSTWHRELALKINPNVKLVPFHFCTSLDTPIAKEKQYDFAYWAADINKAGIDAIMSFVRAAKVLPELSLLIVGGYDEDTQKTLTQILDENKVKRNVTFAGYQPSHLDALKLVSKAKYALLPIKIDILSTTIREAINMKMPVVTYATKGTPHMNKNCECLLISEIGDYDNMAFNMIRLMTDSKLANSLNENAWNFSQKYWNNEHRTNEEIEILKAIYRNFYYNENIPDCFSYVVL